MYGLHLMEMKKLSSDILIVYRWIYPLFFGVGSLVCFFALLFGAMKGKHDESPPEYVKWIVLMGGSMTTGWAVIQAMLIQEVIANDETLIVSGWRGSEEIPFRDIDYIEETRLRNPKLVLIRLRVTSKYGGLIRFIPRGNGVFMGEHPIVSELNLAVKRGHKEGTKGQT